ncbi:MAG: hypothetical protein RLZZ618_3235 [Pseudomonadota bacterium]|jgi:iron(III) transport system ATP-binding protein
MTASLQLNNISVAYRRSGSQLAAVEGVTLNLPAGEIGCLLGPSGCGKTSVLRAIAGFEPLAHGSILLGDMEISSARHHMAPERRKVGMMFQEVALFPHLNASENIAFGLKRMAAPAREARVKALLDLVGLADFGQRYAHELSGGQQQRVALARALAPAPALLLLDEPFSSLDHATREHLAHEVRGIIKAAGQTAILVTHDESEGRTFADRVGTMVAGKLVDWKRRAVEPKQPVSLALA